MLEPIVHLVPPRRGAPMPLRALIFDSWFDSYRGVSPCCGCGRTLRVDRRSGCGWNGKVFELEGLGYQSPKPVAARRCRARGYMFANIRRVGRAHRRHGDGDANPAPSPCPASRKVKPMCFAGLPGGIARAMGCCATRSRNCG